jgi:hypothetical protein
VDLNKPPLRSMNPHPRVVPFEGNLFDYAEEVNTKNIEGEKVPGKIGFDAADPFPVDCHL